MEILILWVFGSFVAAVIADRKGRSGMLLFLVSVFLSPVIGVIAALVMKPDVDYVESQLVLEKKNKKCPHCAELIKVDAVVCRYCGRDLPMDAPVEPPVVKNSWSM